MESRAGLNISIPSKIDLVRYRDGITCRLVAQPCAVWVDVDALHLHVEIALDGLKRQASRGAGTKACDCKWFWVRLQINNASRIWRKVGILKRNRVS